jgi:hypothetical protein
MNPRGQVQKYSLKFEVGVQVAPLAQLLAEQGSISDSQVLPV